MLTHQLFERRPDTAHLVRSTPSEGFSSEQFQKLSSSLLPNALPSAASRNGPAELAPIAAGRIHTTHERYQPQPTGALPREVPPVVRVLKDGLDCGQAACDTASPSSGRAAAVPAGFSSKPSSPAAFFAPDGARAPGSNSGYAAFAASTALVQTAGTGAAATGVTLSEGVMPSPFRTAQCGEPSSQHAQHAEQQLPYRSQQLHQKDCPPPCPPPCPQPSPHADERLLHPHSGAPDGGVQPQRRPVRPEAGRRGGGAGRAGNGGITAALGATAAVKPRHGDEGATRGRANTDGNDGAGHGIRVGVGGDELLAEVSTREDSWVAHLVKVPAAGNGRPELQTASAAAAAAGSGDTGGGGGGGGGAKGPLPLEADSDHNKALLCTGSSDLGFVKASWNTSQPLLPPLLVRTVGMSVGGGSSRDGGRTQGITFFGPGALPGLMPPGASGGGAAGGGVHAGPMFLHLASTANRQQVTGMVPSALACLPNDSSMVSLGGGSFSSSVHCGSVGFAAGGNNVMPSGLAAIACRSGNLTTTLITDSNGQVSSGVAIGGRVLESPWVVWTGPGRPQGLDPDGLSPATGGVAVGMAAVGWRPPDVSGSGTVAIIQPFLTGAQLPTELMTLTEGLLGAAGAEPTAPDSPAAAAAAAAAAAGNGAGGGDESPGQLYSQGLASGSAGQLSYPRALCRRDATSKGLFTARAAQYTSRGSTSFGAAALPANASAIFLDTGPPSGQRWPASAKRMRGCASGLAATGSGRREAKAGTLTGVPPALALPADSPVSCSGRAAGVEACGSSEGKAALETPLARWQRAARVAGLTASIARRFRTLRNQHDENLVRENQLQVVGEIGAGTFARVDKCLYMPGDGAKPFLVAVKRIKREMLGAGRDPEDLQLFIQEAQLLRKLNHPHIVQYIGLGVITEPAPEGGPTDGSPSADQLPFGNRGFQRCSSAPRDLLQPHREGLVGAEGEDEKEGGVGGPVPGPSGNGGGYHARKSPLPESRGGPLAASRPHGGRRKPQERRRSSVEAWDEKTKQEVAAAVAATVPPPPPPPLLRGLFIVEEYMGGGTLKGAVHRQMLHPQRQLYSNSTALRWMAQVAGALSYMHTCRPKVLHRDIKLDNVLLTLGTGQGGACLDACVAKLGDLGLAALLSDHRQASTESVDSTEADGLEVDPDESFLLRKQSDVSRAVRERVIAGAAQAPLHTRGPAEEQRLHRVLESHKRDRLGTYMYMAPEVFRRQKYDEKCDCFSFAMVLYEVFHRYIVAASLESSTQMEKYARQVAQGFRPTIHEDLPAALRRVIKQCWAQDPAARPDMAAVAQELRAMEARGVLAGLDRQQQAGPGCCGGCVVS